TLDSVTGVGTGTSGRVNTAADTLAARSTTSGGVFVNESNAVTLDVLGAANRAAGAAAYDVTAGGTITVSGVVNTGGTGTTTLATSAGDIEIGRAACRERAATVLASAGNNTSTGLVSGTDVTVYGVTGVGTGTSGRVNTAADTLAARSTTSGGVFVNESNAVTMDVLGAASRAAGAAAYDVTAGGTITVSGVVNTGGTGTTTLATSAGDIEIGRAACRERAATVLASAGNNTSTGLVSGTDVTVYGVTGVGTGTSGRVNTAADTLAARSTTSGGVFVNESNAVTMDVLGAASRAAGAAAYDVTAGGTITVSGVVNTGGTGTTTLATSAGDIEIGRAACRERAATVLASAGNNTSTGLVSGTDVTLDSVTGVGTGTSGRVNTAADTLAARSTTSGGVLDNESNAVSLDVLGAANRAAGAAAYDVTAGGTITVSGVVNTGGTGTTTLATSAGDIALGANVGNACAATVLTSAGNIFPYTTVFRSDVTLDSVTGVGTGTSGRVNTAADTLAARSTTSG